MTRARPDDALILPLLLEQRADSDRDRVFIQEVGGPAVTYGEIHERSLRIASAMRDKGIRRGDRVTVMLRNGADGVAVWAAAGLVGAIFVPLNTAYLGTILRDALDSVEPRMLVVDADFLPRFEALEVALPEQVVVRASEGEVPPADLDAVTVTPFAEVLRTPASPLPFPRPSWEDLGCLMFTSGTTGRSKAVMMPWLQLYRSGMGFMQGQELGPDDVIHCPWPINHISGAGSVYTAAARGARLVVREKWSRSAFLDDVYTYGCTMVSLMGQATAALWEMEPLTDRGLCPLEHVFLAPTKPDPQPLMDRFGARYCTVYNSTELSAPISSVGLDPVPEGSCGRLREGARVRIVDGEGEDVPVGEIGELLVRFDDRYEGNLGYWGHEEATAEAWADGWFHTGDAVRQTADGWFFFEGRLKDRIRRRSENISAYEVEQALRAHPGVEDCAAVGVPDGSGEDLLVVFVILGTGAISTEAELLDHARATLPKFMVPDEVRLVAAFPETPTGKIQLHELRKQVP